MCSYWRGAWVGGGEWGRGGGACGAKEGKNGSGRRGGSMNCQRYMLTKKMARFTKGRSRPYEGPKMALRRAIFCGKIDREGSCIKAARGP